MTRIPVVGPTASNHTAKDTPISPSRFHTIFADTRSSAICRVKSSGIPRTLFTLNRAPPLDLSRSAQGIDLQKSITILASPYAGRLASLLFSCMTGHRIAFDAIPYTTKDYSAVKCTHSRVQLGPLSEPPVARRNLQCARRWIGPGLQVAYDYGEKQTPLMLEGPKP